jgi:hypothetical protein
MANEQNNNENKIEEIEERPVPIPTNLLRGASSDSKGNLNGSK